MLEKLVVQNVALIEKAEVEFSEGLNVLSGETGAGKSVLLDSIDFVLGAKADKSLIRFGTEQCTVRADFRLDSNSEVYDVLDEFDIEKDETLIITRKFTMDGKNTIKVNGETVNATMLKKITSHLVDIHGQSEHFFLLKEANQLKLLDKMGGEVVEKAKSELSSLLSERKEIKKQLDSLGGDEGERSRRMDVLSFQIEELSKANLKEGEEEALLELRNKIVNAEKLIDGISSAHGALDGDGGSLDSVRSAIHYLTTLSRLTDDYSELIDRLENVQAELSDVASTLDDAMDELDFDPKEAQRVEERLDELRSLKKKYGGSIENAIEYLEKARAELELLSDSGERIEKLQKELEVNTKKLYKACEKISIVRKDTASGFTNRVTEELKSLNIVSARFEVQFNEYTFEDVDRATSDGLDQIKFLFSANAGEPLKEMSKIISGGEMSRFMLAMKSQLSTLGEIGTYLFDEIDAGISGQTAKVVGEKFIAISRKTQIIAVSHLPQIAVCADKQFLIQKESMQDRTITKIIPLDEERRIEEISRLIGGDKSELSYAHAKEMLNNAKSSKTIA